MPDDTDHLGRVRDAFGQNAARFDAYATTAGKRTAERFGGGLGPAATGRILDVACGTGVVCAALAPNAAEVVGLDATDAMLDRARARARCEGLGNVSFRTGDAEALPFPDGSFDGVVTRLAVHHFADPARVMAEIARVLRPGGRLVVVDVLASDDPERAALQTAIDVLRDPSHTRMLTAAELDACVAGAGLRIVATDGWETQREAAEWLDVAAGPRAGPLATIMRALAAAGVEAGIDLALSDGRTTFVHRWRLIAAEKPGPA